MLMQPVVLAAWLGGLLEKGLQRAHSSKTESENGFAGIVVSLETSPEILLVLPKKYTWTSPGFFLDFSGLFPVFFLGWKNRFFTNFFTKKWAGNLGISSETTWESRVRRPGNL